MKCEQMLCSVKIAFKKQEDIWKKEQGVNLLWKGKLV